MSCRRKGVRDCWSVALWWSVSYPASGLAGIDEYSPPNVSKFPKDLMSLFCLLNRPRFGPPNPVAQAFRPEGFHSYGETLPEQWKPLTPQGVSYRLGTFTRSPHCPDTAPPPPST